MSDAPKTEQKKPAGKSKMPLFAGVGVLVAALAGGGYWFMAKPKAAAKEKSAKAKADGAEQADEEEADTEEAGERALLPLEPFVVNLADEGGTHFLRTNIQLVIAAKEEEVKVLEEKKVQVAPVRSAVLELLAQQKAAELVTPEGKEALKTLIKKRAQAVFKKHKIKEVLFSEFVVQF